MATRVHVIYNAEYLLSYSENNPVMGKSQIETWSLIWNLYGGSLVPHELFFN